MKTNVKKFGILASITLTCLLLYSFYNNPEEEIIGTWVLESDTNSKWVFTNDNCYWYYQNNLEETFSYTILDFSNTSNSTSICGQEIKTGGSEDYYLKLTDQENEDYCYEIFGLDNSKLSVNFLGQAKIQVFIKQ